MKKIATLFARDEDTNRRYVKDEVTPGCEWVLRGEGVATRKYDGTCVKLDTSGEWWARREVKPGKEPPPFFMKVETDDVTGKTVGWEPADQSGFARWLAEAVADDDGHGWDAGTYELVGPKINGNPENAPSHMLLMHEDAARRDEAPRDFDGLRGWLLAHDDEGIVWHHPDGRMAKLKRRDFPKEVRGD